jgi:ATP-dependent Clp protease ATP-binding subunit ClpA
MPRAQTLRPAERYLAVGAREARAIGHNYIGTEHLLLGLTRDRERGAARLLRELGITHRDVAEILAGWLVGVPAPEIDPDALAALGIDFDAVRDRLEETFGPGALERTGPACLGIAPRLKLALAYAVDEAGGGPPEDEHVLVGMLRVPDSLAARALGQLGVILDAAGAISRTSSHT